MINPTAEHLAWQRLQNQRLAGAKCATPAEVVRWMGALQAQDYGQAVWAIGARLEQPSLAAVERAIAAGEIVRTWPMRGTIHLVPAEDARWLLRLLTPRIVAADGRRLRQLGLTQAMVERCGELLQAALQGGQRRTRAEITALFETHGLPAGGPRTYHILWQLAQRGLICIGPLAGKQQTFVLLEEWASAPRDLDGEAALAELARRYATSHGPATVHDLAAWAGLTVTQAKLGLQAAGPALVNWELDGKTYWTSAEAAAPIAPQPRICLLPGFDEYLLGYKDRTAQLNLEYRDQVVPGGNGIFFPMIVVDGQIVGTWKRIIKPRSVVMSFNIFVAKAVSEQQLIPAAQDYADFLGLPLEIAKT